MAEVVQPGGRVEPPAHRLEPVPGVVHQLPPGLVARQVPVRIVTEGRAADPRHLVLRVMGARLRRGGGAAARHERRGLRVDPRREGLWRRPPAAPTA